MYKTNIFILCLLASMMFTCSDKKSESKQDELSVQELRVEVMRVHDEVMPLMSEIERLTDKLESIEASSIDSLEKEIMIKDLAEASDAMWDWMHKYEDASKEETEEEKRMHYQDELQKIERVAIQMKSSIENAKNATVNA